MDVDFLYKKHCINKCSNVIIGNINKSLVDLRTKNTKKYSYAYETRFMIDAHNNKYLCVADLTIYYKTDKESIKIAKALKKLAETHSVKLNVEFKRL